LKCQCGERSWRLTEQYPQDAESIGRQRGPPTPSLLFHFAHHRDTSHGPLPPTIHTVEVKAQALIECRGSGGEVIACPTGTLAGYTNASTQAAIGKATLLVEEQQNWGKQ